jgi:hypothetical protein
MKISKKVFFIGVFLLLNLIAINPLLAKDEDADKYGLKNTAKNAYGGDETDIPFLNMKPAGIIGQVIGAALSFIGILFFGLMIYGGFLWMTARGNEQKVEKAKELIIAAVIGLIIVMSAYAITAFVGEALTKTG